MYTQVETEEQYVPPYLPLSIPNVVKHDSLSAFSPFLKAEPPDSLRLFSDEGENKAKERISQVTQQGCPPDSTKPYLDLPDCARLCYTLQKKRQVQP
jgi:hypothetical protein